ncbi:MAG: tetratricopeptide repeat protein [Lachnospiraceae bacterium]|nr:tetratricopeptide repeat protein [Lachnospiraceae bacterium]
MGLLLCTKKAKNPYKLPETDINIYCIEELCYYIYNNTYMITTDFFTRELIDFLENELGLLSLGQKLKRGIDYNEHFVDLVMHIMNSCNYYNADEKSEFAKNMEQISNKSPAGRVKARADMLLSNKKYSSAIAAYLLILEKKDISKDEDYCSNIMNNIGIAYANMFEYEEAAGWFEKAYKMLKKEDYLDNMICAAILNDSEEEITRIKGQYNISQETFDKYRRVIEYQTKQIAKSKKYREIMEKVSYDTNKSMELYRKQVDETLADFRNEYRKQFGN